MTHTSGTESLQNGSNQYLRHFSYNVVSYIWCWDHNSSFKSRNCQMSDPWGIKRAGWRNDPGTPPREVCFPKELVAPPWAQQNSMKSASYFAATGSLNPMLPTLKPEDIRPSELHSPLPLGQECHLCLWSLPNEGSTVIVILHFSTVVWLLGQPHKYITMFLHQWHWQKSSTLLLSFPVGVPSTGYVAVLANSPTSKHT